jgi:hypothetical protein
MEQLQELLNLLSKTPEMALWGAGIYFAFVLLKAASWISASAFVLRLFITRYFDWKEKSKQWETEQVKMETEISQLHSKAKIAEIDYNVTTRNNYPLHNLLEKDTYDGGHSLHKLLLAIGDGRRCHVSDIERVTKLVLTEKAKKPA